MNIIFSKEHLSPLEIELLHQEFPQYKLLTAKELDLKTMGKDQCSLIEILYGEQLLLQEFVNIPQVRWIHVPTPYLSELCLEAIQKQGNVLVTTTKEENLVQIGEFAIGVSLAFAKHLFFWHKATQHKNMFEESEQWKKEMWSTQNRIHLQIELGKMGTEIALRARQMGFKVWGVKQERSFHQYCHKTLAMKDLHSVLPFADVVCLSLPRDQSYVNLFKLNELELMKKDAILLVLGSRGVVNLEDLAAVAKTGKLRGILLDTHFQSISLTSPLWDLPNVLITPEVSIHPKQEEVESFRTFLYNLRQFIHGNFTEMKNLVDQGMVYQEQLNVEFEEQE